MGVALASSAVAHADGCARFRVGVAVAGGTALALIASGASLDGVAYSDKQNAHAAPTLGAYNADFRESARISTGGEALVDAGIAAGVLTGVASLLGFATHGGCSAETRRVAAAHAGFQVHF